jgi:tetratricopeptide (TPR) repeat protein
MLFEERLARASEHRKRGNVAFGEGGDGDGDEKEAKTREARAEYEMALSFLTDDMMMQLPPGPHADAAAAEKLPAHLNLCACFLRLGRHDDAIDQANRALIVDPKCAKAYFRRGEARRALGRDDDARADYAKANELRQSAGGGEDPAIRRALRRLDCEDAKRARARKEVFGGLFGAPGAGAGGGEGGEGEKTRGGEASPRGERSDGGGGVFGRIARAFGFRGSRGAKR